MHFLTMNIEATVLVIPNVLLGAGFIEGSEMIKPLVYSTAELKSTGTQAMNTEALLA